MPAQPLIRDARIGDIAALVELWGRAGLLRPWNDPVKDIQFALDGETSTVLVLESDGRLLASAMTGHDGHRGWVYYLAVDPDAQRQGLGRQMMEAVEAWHRARGVWKVQLLVREGNEQVIAFYETLGYVDTRSVCLQKVIG